MFGPLVTWSPRRSHSWIHFGSTSVHCVRRRRWPGWHPIVIETVPLRSTAGPEVLRSSTIGSIADPTSADTLVGSTAVVITAKERDTFFLFDGTLLRAAPGARYHHFREMYPTLYLDNIYYIISPLIY